MHLARGASNGTNHRLAGAQRTLSTRRRLVPCTHEGTHSITADGRDRYPGTGPAIRAAELKHVFVPRTQGTGPSVWSVVARVCCLLVLNSVTSTPQWIRQPEAAVCVHRTHCAWASIRFMVTLLPLTVGQLNELLPLGASEFSGHPEQDSLPSTDVLCCHSKRSKTRGSLYRCCLQKLPWSLNTCRRFHRQKQPQS
jgi:hypothetical protein